MLSKAITESRSLRRPACPKAWPALRREGRRSARRERDRR